MRLSFVLMGLTILLLGPFALSVSEGLVRPARELAKFHQDAPPVTLRHPPSSLRRAAASAACGESGAECGGLAEAGKARYSEITSAKVEAGSAVGEPLRPHSSNDVTARAKHARSSALAPNVKYRPPRRLAAVSSRWRPRFDIGRDRRSVIWARDASGLPLSLW
jgi:hypothetical protein